MRTPLYLAFYLLCADIFAGQKSWKEIEVEFDPVQLSNNNFITTQNLYEVAPVVLLTQEKNSIPGTQAWSSCRNCLWNGSNFVFYGNSTLKSVKMSFSFWGEFFYERRNDIIEMTHISDGALVIPAGSIIFEIPVIWFPIITFHVGHVLVDFIEQVYWTIHEHVSVKDKRVLILVDVGNVKEIKVLQRNLDVLVGDESVNCFAKMLKWFSDMPVLAVQSFQLQFSSKSVLFKHIYFGGNNSYSFFSSGVSRHPCRFQHYDIYVQKQAKLYQQFRDFIDENVFIAPHLIDQAYKYDILLVQRTGSRVILNADAIFDVAEQMGLSILQIDFANCPFSDQLLYLQSSKILVMAAGTGAHNMLFVRPGSLVTIAMQPDWCDWAWQYANQGVLLDIQVSIHCQSLSQQQQHRQHFHWTSQYWLQGPRSMKQSNITLDIDKFRNDISQFLRTHTSKHSEHGNVHGQGTLTHLIDQPWCSPETQYQPTKNVVIHPSFMSSSHFRLSIFHLEIIEDKSQPGDSRQLYFMGEIAASHPSPTPLFSQFTHLSVCMDIYTTLEAKTHFCFTVDQCNFHSNVIIASTSDVMGLHLWAQVSPSGGKFAYSDVFIVLDLRQPFQPSMLLHEPGSDVAEAFHYQCPIMLPSLNNQSSLEFVYHTYDKPDDSDSLFAWQYEVADFCRSHSLLGKSSGQCMKSVSQIYHCMHIHNSLRNNYLPQIQYVPTPEYPFIFLHIEKAGGTSLRSMIHHSAELHGLDFFIPAFGGIHKCTFSLPTNVSSTVSVVAGHFSWGVWTSLPKLSLSETIAHVESGMTTGHKEGDKGHTVERFPVACFVMGREPVDRIVSYYYQRCYSEKLCTFYQKQFNELTPAELRNLLMYFRQALLLEDNQTIAVVDEGMEDAACRTMIGKRETTGIPVSDVILPQPLTEIDTKLALSNCEQCVVGLLEDWENTERVMQFWFPWMDLSEYKALNHFARGAKDAAYIRDDLRAVILELNQCDVILYEKMKEIFTKELRVVNDIKSYEFSL